MCAACAALFRWLLRIKPKCYVCRERNSREKNSVPRYGIYGEVYDPYFFHPECVRAALDDPELYGHDVVDRALWIVDQLRGQKNERDEKSSRRNLRIEEAKGLLELEF